MNSWLIFAVNPHYVSNAGAFMLGLIWAVMFAKLFLGAFHNRLAGLVFFAAFGAFWGTLLCWQDCPPYFVALDGAKGKGIFVIRLVGGTLGGFLGFLLTNSRYNRNKTKGLSSMKDEAQPSEEERV